MSVGETGHCIESTKHLCPALALALALVLALALALVSVCVSIVHSPTGPLFRLQPRVVVAVMQSQLLLSHVFIIASEQIQDLLFFSLPGFSGNFWPQVCT